MVALYDPSSKNNIHIVMNHKKRILMKVEIITLSIEMVRKSCFFATPGRTICAWRIGKSTDQELFIREIYNGDKEWIYTKFGDYRHVSKI